MSGTVTPDYPMPGECHPDFERAGVREWLAVGDYSRGCFRVMDQLNFDAVPTKMVGDSGDEFSWGVRAEVVALELRWVVARAPYVGRPCHYRWPVLVAPDGRAVGGDTERVYDPVDEWTGRWPDPYAAPEAWW